MRRLGLWLVLAQSSCDDSGGADGARGPCAAGPDSLACAEAVTSPASACSPLVACAALPLDAAEGFDWGECVDNLESLTEDRARLVIGCVAASRCDELRVMGSPQQPRETIYCLALGRR
jgi:hypothetical protein